MLCVVMMMVLYLATIVTSETMCISGYYCYIDLFRNDVCVYLHLRSTMFLFVYLPTVNVVVFDANKQTTVNVFGFSASPARHV